MGKKVVVLIPDMVKTQKKVSAFTIVNALYKVTLSATSKDIRDLRNPKSPHYNVDWCKWVSVLQHNTEKHTEIAGVKYALGGVYSGKETPHVAIEQVLDPETCPTRLKGIEYHPMSTGKVCKSCGEKIGVKVKYKAIDPKVKGKGKGLPTLNQSHGIPCILGGSATINNLVVECAYCNKMRSMFFDPNVRQWLKRVKFDLYELPQKGKGSKGVKGQGVKGKGKGSK
jgi:hypothetical protein